eukprot:g20246.t1
MGSPEGAKLSVWVCQEEKVVCGLTKRTSCAQVVRALLRDHLAHAGDTRLLHAPPRDYCLAEKWRGFERLLPPATKLLRLWLSWGPERRNVRFVLVKWDARLPLPGLWSAEAKVVPSSSGGGEGQRGERRPAARSVRDLPRDKQRRMVRKAFRKLAKMKRLRQGRERMETLVHLIVSQDHTIRQQLSRLRELDGDIERFEGRLHSERVQSDGQNYVQETYLLEGGQLQEYLERSEAVCRLEEDLERHREAVRRLSEELELEREQLCGGGGDDNNSGPERPEEGSSDSLQGELERSACCARQLGRSLADVQRRLQQQEAALREKAEEYERLARQLECLSLAEE